MEKTKKLSIAFYWHMHQPVYQLTEDGDFLMPWVRFHAVKDYLDMVSVLKDFKRLKLNFNLVPVLLDSLIDYSEKNYHDIHSRLTVTSISELTDDDKEFVLNNFFDANYQSMIFPYPRYNELYQKRYVSENLDIKEFSEQDLSDLMAWFNLVWIDPSHRAKYPKLRALYKKGANFTLEDRIEIINIHRDIIKKIIPTYKKYLEEGKIEITTSPYYHPILPILLDIKKAESNLSMTVGLPNDLKMNLDAKKQTEMAVNRIEEIFGKKPTGIWPSELCVSPKTLEMFSELGIDWAISDEGILSNSINFKFVRDFKGYMEDPYHLVKPYLYETKNSSINMIFRDSLLPNFISFEYPKHDYKTAASDLYDKIKVMQNKLLTSPDENHILTIAMDGENCWENYEDDGAKFLKTIYSMIENDETLDTVLISDYIKKDKHPKTLNKIFSGSWVNRNFQLWIGEPVKNLAWNYVKNVRDELAKFVKEDSNNPNIPFAQRELFITEGSDWFWWYGEPNDSGQDHIFDYLFREHLKNIYRYLNKIPPKYLDTPLISVAARPSRYPKSIISPQIDGSAKFDDEWLNAGCISMPDGPVLQENKLFDKICFGFDSTKFYLRLYLNNFTRENLTQTSQFHELYIYLRNCNKKQSLSPIRLINKTESIFPIIRERFHNEIQVVFSGNTLFPINCAKAIGSNLWTMKTVKDIKVAYDDVIDISIPFEDIDIESGDLMEFFFVNGNFGVKDSFIPQDVLLTLKRP